MLDNVGFGVLGRLCNPLICGRLLPVQVAATIRDPQHVETSIVEPGPLLRDDGFWRLCALNTVFIFAYSNFRHMESTFPKSHGQTGLGATLAARKHKESTA